jgi:hypothetical protein
MCRHPVRRLSFRGYCHQACKDLRQSFRFLLARRRLPQAVIMLGAVLELELGKGLPKRASATAEMTTGE